MILRARWVAPVAGGWIRDGWVALDGPRIAAVGTGSTAGAGGPVFDLGNTILTPGLINPHTHLELACYAGVLPPGPFWEWLAKIVALRNAPGAAERETAAIAAAAWQSLRHGVTCVGDIARTGQSWRVLKPLPIRKVCFVELLSLAAQPPRTPDELAAAVAAVEEDELLTAGISPHAPYSVPLVMARAALELAAKLDRPWMVHLAETPEELAFLAGDPGRLPEPIRRAQQRIGMSAPRQTAAGWLAAARAAAPRGAAAHCNYLSEEEIAPLAASGDSVIYCPRAHAFFGHPPHPLPRLLAAGVRVALATDSPASNSGVGLLEEARLVRTALGSAAPLPDVLLRAMTLGAAEALHLADRIGSLEAGKRADLAAFDCPAGHDDPAAWLLDHAPPARHVWVDGRCVVGADALPAAGDRAPPQ